MSDSPTDWEALVRDILQDAFGHLGYAAQLDGDLVTVDQREFAFRPRIGDHHPTGNLETVQVEMEILFRPTDQEGIRTDHTGIGPDARAAVQQAVVNWFRGVWRPVSHVFLEEETQLVPVGLTTYNDDHSVMTPWLVFVGDLLEVGEHSEMLKEQLEQTPPLSYLERPFQELHARGELSEVGFCWANVFLARQSEGNVFGEVSFLNQSWPEAWEALSAFPWPVEEGAAGYRQFFLIVRQEDVPLN